MKKLLAILAIAGVLAACNNGTDSKKTTSDTTIMTADTTGKMTTDTTRKMSTDTTNKMSPDTSKKK